VTASEFASRPLRILIVEDDPTFRSVLQLLLGKEWDVEAVPDAESALLRVREARPHLMLVDFMLPGMDGVELARVLREDPQTRGIPVVMLSGVADVHDRERALDCGILDVLAKPVSERDLRRRVESLADVAAAHRGMLDAAHERLKVAEERLRLLSENIRDYAIVMLGVDGTMEGWNSGAVAIHGWSEDEVLGRHVSLLFPDAEGPRVSRLLGEAAVTHSAHDSGWQVRKDGRAFWADTVATALYGEPGLRGFAMITRDLTERRRVEDERERMLAEARAANLAKEQFLATLSHELRTPLNAIIGWVHLLRSGSLDEQKAAHALQVVDRNARHQARMVADILDLSRIMVSRARLDTAPTSVTSAVSAALDTARPAASAKRLTLEVDLAEVALVMGDGPRLEQVVSNVLDNAIKFTPAGGRVTVTTRHQDGQVRVVVADEGPGIPAEFLPRVFSPFEQVDSSATRQHGGMGLGLSLARLLVERHGGSIELDSAPGRGTTVTIVLPAIGEGGGAGPDVAEVPVDLTGLRVLVVDDHPDTLEFVSTLLSSAGAAPLLARGADEALGLLLRARPDVLLADLEMPGRSGLDLIRTLRALPAESGGAVPAAAFTASVRPEDRAGALAAGYDTHIGKPVRPDELVRTMALLRHVRPEARAAAGPTLLPPEGTSPPSAATHPS
jgi:PAS domain S-box-containing protein